MNKDYATAHPKNVDEDYLMNEKYTVGKYLVDRLYEIGLRHLFSIAGDYSLNWLNNYVERSEIKIIQEVNELCAGYAADGYAKIKGIGALCVTYSAGALSAVNNISGAYEERVPIVLINGAPSINKIIKFEQTGFIAHHIISSRQTNRQVFENITAAAITIDKPHLAPSQIDYALTICITERRPIYIELLEDMVDQPCDSPIGKLTITNPSSDKACLDAAVQVLKMKLMEAVNPIIWVGVEIDRFRLAEETQQLIKQLGIPYVTQLLSKAVLSENDPQFAGVFDGFASAESTQALAKKSDFVLALGVWLTDINDLGEMANVNQTAFVSMNSVKFGAQFFSQVALSDLLKELMETKVNCKTCKIPAKQDYLNVRNSLQGEITYQGFYDFIPKFIDETTIIGSDASMNYFGSMLLKVVSTGGYIAQSSYSSIGYIGPAGTGICLAKQSGQRVMLFSGDGGFQMTAQCLSTQTRFELNPIIFVIDNGVYAVEQWLSNPSKFPQKDDFYESCRLHPWHYSKLADVFDCKGYVASTYHELEIVVEKALSNKKCPSLIQVVVPATSIPDNARR